MKNQDLQYFENTFNGEIRPIKLYKFATINQNTINSLLISYLWYSKPNDFNDPYDCYRNLISLENPKKDYMQKILSEHLNLQGDRLNQLVEAQMSNPTKIQMGYSDVTECLMLNQGICCFTSNHANTLMWSHYADNHKGICLIFNPLLDFDNFVMAKVNYKMDFEPLNYFDDEKAAFMNMVTTKSKEWEYEAEFRTFRVPGARPYKKEALIGIIFGCKCSKKDKETIIKLMKGLNRNLYYLQAVINKNSFRLDFEEFIITTYYY